MVGRPLAALAGPGAPGFDRLGLAAGFDRLRLALSVTGGAPIPDTGGYQLPRPRASAPAGGPDPSPPEGEQAEVMGAVARAQNGDAAAFGELYDRYVDQVYRYVYYRVGAAALAEDLTSDTFLRALRRIGSFRWQGRDFGAWLVTIARNLIADHFKSSRYRMELSSADLIESGAEQAAAGPEGAVLEALTNATLLEAVKRLNPEQQECVALRFLQGMSVAETALAMGKNEGAIKALQYRAVRSLARLLPSEPW
ncbi:MAG TPA: ECF subfamily RNA polymerase sigma factor, BldN family [Mycobacteriales bacterium]|nr:ECF subfamily RNA polymerase sigma factor, BldN family [Mycobacteriales bacterium]